MPRLDPLKRYFSSYRDPGEAVSLALNAGPAATIFLRSLFGTAIFLFVISWLIGGLLQAPILAKLFVSCCCAFVGTIPIAYVVWRITCAFIDATANIIYRQRLEPD